MCEVTGMIKLTDYLYNGDTVLKIIDKYASDLLTEAGKNGSRVDEAHGEYLADLESLLIHNDFLTSQSQRIRDFYMEMVRKYPYLAFSFKGRIKSLIRAEEKFDRKLVNLYAEAYEKDGTLPDDEKAARDAASVRDLIAYRIIISIPKCHLGPDEDEDAVNIGLLYKIAEELPAFLELEDFVPQSNFFAKTHPSSQLSDTVKPYYKDYVEYASERGYQSLHIAFLDKVSDSIFEIQLRTKKMDDYAEIGQANHFSYEEGQHLKENRRALPEGLKREYDEAYERLDSIRKLDLTKVDVNMFTAVSNVLINDNCGLFRGRLILPYEHLSRFQNDRMN